MWRGAALVAFAGACAVAISAQGATPIPVPSPIAIVHTKSGNVERHIPVPIGGVAVPIDVDNGQVLGLLSPDVDVSVGLIAAEELPGRPIVPTVRIARSQLAVVRNAPAPPLKIDVTIEILDAGNLSEKLATVSYGYETPPGASIPPLVKLKLLGPITSGFIDPLEAVIDAPGYEAPLTFNAKAVTRGLDADFKLTFDPLPKRIHFVEDPRDDGLDFRYDHQGPNPDINLTGRAELTDKATGDRRTIDASVDRLPPNIGLSYTGRQDGLTIDYTQSLATTKPDVDANYRETLGDGTVATDANVKVAGLPNHLAGTLRSSTDAEGNSSLSYADFRVLDGGQIDAIDFLARNWTGDPGGLPEIDRRPDQYVAVATRRNPDGSTRYRAAGHVRGVRGVRYERAGEGFDVTTDIGDGIRPLTASLDTDSRGPGADPDKAKRIALDTTVTPLPRQIHARFEPATETEPTRVSYDSPTSVDVDATAEIDAGDQSGCGKPKVTCATARVDKLPPELDLRLPGEGQQDFAVDHTGTIRPDVRATVDLVGDAATDRTWAEIALLGVPRHVQGRLAKQPNGFLDAAEFHTCDSAFEDATCPDAQPSGLGSVRFTVRGRPDRQGLPDRPDASPQHVTLLKRDGAFEVDGRVDQVRNVAVHQRASAADAEVAEALGYLVDTGTGEPFDVKVDSDTADADVPGHRARTEVDAHVDSLPTRFTGCLRSADPDNAPQDEPDDDLLEPCDRTEVPGFEELDSTPLSLNYDAATPARARVRFSSTKAEELEGGGHEDRTTAIDTTVDEIPQGVDVDVVAPDEEHPERKLRVRYQARDDAAIPRIDLDFQSRGAADHCGDPRPGRATLCLDATLRNMPGRLALTKAPDATDGTIDVSMSEPEGSVDIDPLHLQTTSRTGASPLDVSGHIKGLTPHLTATLRSVDPDGAGPEEPELGELSFDACPDGDDECDGIDEIDLDAHNGFFAEALPAPPAESTTHKLSFVQRGADFRANVLVRNFKSIGYSSLGTGGELSSMKTIKAGFGSSPGASMHAYVDTDDGVRSMLADGVVTHMPSELELCLRPPLEPQAPDPPDRGAWCETQDRNKVAVRALVDPAGSQRPDVDLRKLRMETYTPHKLLAARVKAESLPGRLQVLANFAGKPDLDARALTRSGGDDDFQPIGRVTFALRDFEGTLDEAVQYPFLSLDDSHEPMVDPRNVDEPEAPHFGVNYVAVRTSPQRLELLGSVPAVRHVAFTPDRCPRADGEYDEQRFPAPDSYADPTRAPQYTCVQAKAAARRPLGLSIRTLDEDNKVLSVDDGNLSEVPTGGLSATISSSPEKVATAPVCGENAGPAEGCRPPLFSLESPRADDQDPPRFSARLSFGPLDLVREVRQSVPLDPESQRLSYEQHPQDYEADGARVHLGSRAGETAIRAGMRVRLPKYLDLDPPTTFSCLRETDGDHNPVSDPQQPCLGPSPDIGADADNGAESSDLSFKLVAAEDEPGGKAPFPLGRVALLKDDFGAGSDRSQLVLTGVPPADNQTDGLSQHSPENPPDPGAHDLGAVIPSHLEIAVRRRNLYDADDDADGEHPFQSSQYMQIDATTSDETKLNLGLRLNKAGGMGEARPEELPDCFLKEGCDAAGPIVSPIALALRNAPGTDDFARPSFRMRVQMLAPQNNPPEEGDGDGCKGQGQSVGYAKDNGFGAAFCVITPSPEAKWLTAALNAQPDPGADPARTIDALIVRDGPETLDGTLHQKADGGAIVDAELRAFKRVLDGTQGEDRTPADFTAQVGTRLTPFTLGFEYGLGFGILGHFSHYHLDGDLVAQLDGTNIERMRTNVGAGPMRLQSEGGPLHMTADMRAQAYTHDIYSALFGLITIPVRTATDEPYKHGVQMQECIQGGGGGVGSQTSVDTWDTEGPGNVPLSLGLHHQVPAHPFSPNSAWALFGVAGDWFMVHGCSGFAQTPEGYQPAQLPAPPYEEAGRDAGVPQAQSLQTNLQLAAPVSSGTADVTIPANTTVSVCKPVIVRTLTVNGTLQAGVEGTTELTDVIDEFGNLSKASNSCDGNLTILANKVIVGPDGRIRADQTRTNADSPGTPTSGRGGGAGYVNEGGGGADGDLGLGGPDVWEPGEPIVAGSPGRQGTSVAGGKGGGLVTITATEEITLRGDTDDGTGGRITADGERGHPEPFEDGRCDDEVDTVAGGGGSGGGIVMSGHYLFAHEDAVLHANGGDGGDSHNGHGGGGGSGGVIAPTFVVRNLDVDEEADGGDAGDSEECDDGGGGGGGASDEGEESARVAYVTLSEPNASGFYKGELPTIDIRAIDDANEGAVEGAVGNAGWIPEKVHVCFRRLGPTALNATLQSPDLDLPSSVTDVGQLHDEGITDGCMAVRADRPDGDWYEYTWDDVSIEQLIEGQFDDGVPRDGYYGLFAYAERDDAFPNEQNFIPRGAQVRFGYDHSEPTISIEETGGVPGCFDGSLCVRNRTGEADVVASDQTSGVKRARCTVDFTTKQLPCETGHRSFTFAPGDGQHFVDAHLRDHAGNTAQPDYVGRWFVDTKRPARPVIDTSPAVGSQPHNGWSKFPPNLNVTASDPKPSSGFTADAIIVSVDGSARKCGPPAVTGLNDEASTTCTFTGFQSSFIPQNGRHEFTAKVIDRAGNTSRESEPASMQVDSEPPTSRLALVPEPDATSNWYRERPVIAFGTTDNVGGSGVIPPDGEDPEIDDWGVYYRVDNGPEQHWPVDVDDERLPDGVHDICWYARDIAGNKENEQCEQGIHVDSTPPQPVFGLSPAQPDGGDGWYTSAPTIDPDATDPGPSGVASVQQRIDGGPWQPAHETTIGEGTHTVEVRATDEAGNRTDPRLLTVRVDLSNPSQRYGTFPPAPNARDWFRRLPLAQLTSTDGGDNSGPVAPEYGLDAASLSAYERPFAVTQGVRSLNARGRDRSGRSGAVVARTLRVDTTPPVPSIGSPPPEPLLLPGAQTTLRFNVSDNLAPQVKVRVYVFDTLGQYVRTIDASGGAFRPTGAGSVMWNGTDDYGRGAVLGLYHYRVEAIDMAGNSAISTESKQFLYVLPTLPLLPWPLG